MGIEDFVDKKDARASRGSTDRKNHSSEKTKKIKCHEIRWSVQDRGLWYSVGYALCLLVTPSSHFFFPSFSYTRAIETIQKNTMSSTDNDICANCGKEGRNLNTCNKCELVKYCNAACKKKHRSKHEKKCDRRVAEKHDEALFKQPPRNEDCPIVSYVCHHWIRGGNIIQAAEK